MVKAIKAASSQAIPRVFNPMEVLQHKSCFLFGARQTGKTMLIRQTLPNYKVYNLLDNDLFIRLANSPSLIREQLQAEDSIIIIDEIQKLPQLLNEVHLMIEEFGIHFLLTGSSARSLRRKGVNMLGGRARSRVLHPFIRTELKQRFELDRALHIGLIPSIYLSDAPMEDLKAYAGDYLKEEIAAEALVRNIGAFSRFLEIAALCHGQMINFTQVSSDAQVPVSTVREYYQILIDTLIAYELPAYKETRKRKAISMSKYYLFDIGIARYLQGRKELSPRTPEYGDAFESYIFQEIKAYCSYRLIDDLHYWRSKSNFEVDFIIDKKIAVEVKAKRIVGTRDLKGLKALMEEDMMEQYIVVSMEAEPRTVDGIEILPWQVFLDHLWQED